MPLREDILNPIEGDNPSGVNLRYAPLFDKIKEARREDDDLDQGDWQTNRKTADPNTVLKLAGEALATQTKDLQLAAWVTEALLKKEGYAGLLEGVNLLKGLIEGFWDTLYPENEDGDLELRAAPLEWVGTRLEDPLRKTPLTRKGFNYYQYKESRLIPTEEAAAEDEAKAEARNNAVSDGKTTPEDFDAAFNATPTSVYEKYVADLDALQETLSALNDLCNEKFGDVSPSFSGLTRGVEEVRHTANQLLQRKYDLEGRATPVEEEAPAESSSDDGWTTTEGDGSAPAPARRRGRQVAGLEPADADEIGLRLAAVAKWMRAQDPYSPAPYLMLRGLRWGELRGYGESPDPMNLTPPPTEVRQTIKRLSLESNWPELLEVAETSMAEPCGRAWLDLQRYVVKACDESGYHAVGTAIRAELKALLADLPALPDWTLMDDTPTANAETRAWLDSFAKPPEPEPVQESQQESYYEPPPRYEEPSAASETPGEPPPPDTFTLAQEAVRSGRVREAIEMLSGEVARAQSGRARFQRRLELAQICMATGNEAIAHPILDELALAIDEHKLEHWETADSVAHPLVLLYRCMQKMQGDPVEKQKLYARICRLDPQAALAGLR